MKIQFAFHPNETSSEFIPVTLNTSYSSARGYGFSQSVHPSRNEDLRDSWPGDYFLQPVPTFRVDVPFGNYSVTLTLGHPDAPSATTVKAGLGRLMLDNIHTAPGQFVRETFAVRAEDGQLKLAFSGAAPSVYAIEIERAGEMPTLFLAGDSTVTDQPSGQYPYAGWGQMFPKFLTADIAVSNHARSGRSSKSFITENRLNHIWNQIAPSDFLLIQFAHNDEKDNEGGTDAFTTYQHYLKQYIDGARQRGAYPVLVSPMHRRFFDARHCIENTHGDYIEAMRQLAEREEVPFLDLAGKSKRLFEERGEEATKRIFMWAEPNEYANFPDGAQDNTHFTEYGGVEIARLVTECIREAGVEPLQHYLRSN
ncbi:rhamnogalacturonan acetylesterase [Paenibacillus sp. NPDC056579]|uniref:rhamnogalacturonan acetylesterase n=1 Tax=unclassified Paenibacillus TaxID=185978 RepID=UPI001EF86F2D|nr:GDSL-type esterase/lipase family protein [Paenibacillus sp. H1-7]